mgnify:CR=1 FL=1
MRRSPGTSPYFTIIGSPPNMCSEEPLPTRVKTVIPSWSERRDRKETGRARATSIFPPRGVPSGA